MKKLLLKIAIVITFILLLAMFGAYCYTLSESVEETLDLLNSSTLGPLRESWQTSFAAYFFRWFGIIFLGSIIIIISSLSAFNLLDEEAQDERAK